jgi:tetratricopeptide (TPR) repeat protein
MRVGDLQLKRGQADKAIESYAQVAEIFSASGFDAKAVAIYKQILRIDPAQLEAHTRLGDLYQRLGLVSEALRQFQEATEIFQGRGLKREAFDLLKRVAALDPSNISNRLKLADLLAREGMASEALQEYEAMLSDVEDREERVRIAEQAIASFPDHPGALQALARARVGSGQTEEAIEALERARPAHPEDIGLREALIEAYEAVGNADRVQSVYREIAELYKRRGDDERARDILQRFVHVEAFADPDTSPSIELSDECDEFDMGLEPLTSDGAAAGESPELESGPESPSTKSPSPSLGSSSVESDRDPEDLVADAGVSLEFGNLEEAEAQARVALEVAPHLDGARAVLAAVEEQRGNPVAALALHQERHRLAAAGGDAELLSEIETEMARLQNATAPPPSPESSESSDISEELPDVEIVLEDAEDSDNLYASVSPPPELECDEDEDEDDHDFEIDLDSSFGSGDTEPAGEAVELEGAEAIDAEEEPPAVEPESSSSSWVEDSAQIEASLDEAEECYLRGDYEGAEARYTAILEQIPNHPQALLRLGEIASERGDAPESVTGREEAPAVVELEGPDETALEEPDAAALEGSDDSAPEEPDDAALEDPEDFLSSDDIELPEEDPALDGDFDLAAELSSELGAEADESSEKEAAGFQTIFEAFKKGIHDTLGPEECDARYDLAIAYREMGLIDDAVEALDVAVRGGSRRVEALSLIATCKLELGRPEESVAHLEEALTIVGAEDEAATSLHYERASALQAAGQTADALEGFRKVAAEDPGFREVEAQIAELEKLAG